MEWKRVANSTWEIEPHDGMLVPGRIYASAALFEKAMSDRASQQVINVAHFPGIVDLAIGVLIPRPHFEPPRGASRIDAPFLLLHLGHDNRSRDRTGLPNVPQPRVGVNQISGVNGAGDVRPP